MLEALQSVDVTSLEKAIGSCHVPERHLAVDGKALAGRTTEAGDAYHLVSLFGTELCSVLAQKRSKKGGGEISVALDLIKQVEIREKVITGDALYANAQLCEAIVGNGGNYAFTLKSNQQTLRHEMLQVFRLNPCQDHPDVVRSYEEDMSKAHGRIEMRKIEVMSNPYTHYCTGFDTIRQIAKITRYRHVMGTEPHAGEATVSYMVTSLDAGRTTPKELL